MIRFSPYTRLANRRLQPLGHLSGAADLYKIDAMGSNGAYTRAWNATARPEKHIPAAATAGMVRELERAAISWT